MGVRQWTAVVDRSNNICAAFTESRMAARHKGDARAKSCIFQSLLFGPSFSGPAFSAPPPPLLPRPVVVEAVICRSADGPHRPKASRVYQLDRSGGTGLFIIIITLVVLHHEGATHISC